MNWGKVNSKKTKCMIRNLREPWKLKLIERENMMPGTDWKCIEKVHSLHFFLYSDKFWSKTIYKIHVPGLLYSHSSIHPLAASRGQQRLKGYKRTDKEVSFASVVSMIQGQTKIKKTNLDMTNEMNMWHEILRIDFMNNRVSKNMKKQREAEKQKVKGNDKSK